MSKRKYKPEAEGAVFDRRATNPPTSAELVKLLAVDPLRDTVTDCEKLAVDVLSKHYGQSVELIKNEPHMNAEPLAWPINGSVPEIVLDAFEILDLSRSIRTLDRCVNDDVFASNRPAITRNLANCMLSLGKLFVVASLRIEGIESDVFGRVSQKRNLQPRTRIEIDESTLRDEWERIKQSKPHATKQVWRASVADRLGTSERTIKRRLSEFKIV
jgi:hypothetical protein